MICSYAEAAKHDRLQIWLDSAERFGELWADAYIDRLDGTLTSALGAFPNAGRARPEFGPDIRSFPVVPLVAFYRVRNRRIEIVRVLHTHRDLSAPLLSLLVAV